VSAAPLLALRGVGKRFGAHVALAPCDLALAPGEFCSIVGESGCGKTTLLRLAAGLEAPSSGTILFDGAHIDAPQAGIGVVFQTPVLLAWRTALSNVLLPAQITRKGVEPVLQQHAQELLEGVGLGEAGHKLPHELSGGMQSRVALARALLLAPRLLLLDEPFAALDALTRERMAETLLDVWSDNRFTAMFVTHDIGEAVFLADRVVLMAPHPGRLYQSFPVPLPRPRTPNLRFTLPYIELCRHIRAAMMEMETVPMNSALTAQEAP